MIYRIILEDALSSYLHRELCWKSAVLPDGWSILDNFSPHRKLKVLRFCCEHNIHMIWTPTNASWLNLIECQFTDVKEFVIRGTNYQNHNELKTALNK
jgi:transposase